jgi:hypothetical protein
MPPCILRVHLIEGLVDLQGDVPLVVGRAPVINPYVP